MDNNEYYIFNIRNSRTIHYNIECFEYRGIRNPIRLKLFEEFIFNKIKMSMLHHADLLMNLPTYITCIILYNNTI